MSKRGKALGPKYPGIYAKRMADGSHRYTVLISTTDETGKRKQHTQTAASLREAVEIRGQGQAKAVCGQLSSPATKTTLGDMVIEMMARKSTNRTFKDAERNLRDIAAFFGESLPLEDLDIHQVLRYRHDLAKRVHQRTGKPLAGQTKDHFLKELKCLLRAAADEGLIARVPKITFFRGYGEREYNLDLVKFRRLIAGIEGPPLPYRAILLMGLFTGQRKSDLLGMARKQFSLNRVRFKSSKTGRQFVLAVPPVLRHEVEAVLTDSEWLFPNPRTGRPYNDLRKPLDRACERAGIERVTLHMIRHLAADVVANITGNKLFTQKYIGWSSPEMVDRYTHIESWADQIVDEFGKRLERAVEA